MNRSLNRDKADDGEIVLPPFDPAKAMRGVFAHRQGEQPEDEKRAALFWESRGFAVEQLEPTRDLRSRKPDLRLTRNGAPFAYCEVKTVWRHTTRITILHDEQPVEERIEVSKATLEERLTTDLVTAIRQLRYANPDHTLLNFVVLVNRDAEATPGHLAAVLNRIPPVEGKGLMARRAAWTAEEIARFRREVDLCLWANSAEDGELLIEGCYLFNPSLRSFAEEITGMRGDKVISLEPAA
ncbi:MAG TPA: hypothetical protein VG225_00155 [Terracidiphilus sp.]|jgi:hypothetical protein|nr:hypothetical protein [Terracidiphilus sp.]